MKVYTVIVTYNGEFWIRKCLSSLNKVSVPISSIVIDNNSNDRTKEIIQMEFPETQLIESHKNLGFGQANNIGIKRALDDGAEYIFLLNQDAWVQENSIESLIEVSKSNPKYGIISPLHLNGRGDKLDWHFSNYIMPQRCPGLYSDSLLNRPLKDLYSADYVNAAAWLLPRHIFEEVGGFDPLFFHYGEDDNYMQRVIFHGFKIGICPNAHICHDREDRPINPIVDKYMTKRKAIVKYANVNIEGPIELAKRIDILNKKYWIRALTGRKSAKKLKNDLKILKTILPGVTQSWKKNKVKGANYLTQRELPKIG